MITSYEIKPFELSLKTNPFKRNGLILKLSDTQGNSALGEISPLPGWNQETLEQAELQLREILPLLLKGDLPKESLLFPSVSFGLEAALFSLKSSSAEKTFSQPVHGFLLGTVEEVMKRATTMAEEGFTTVKLKIGNRPLKEARFLIDQLKGQFRLRLDVNRAWPLEEANDFFSDFDGGDFDYIEEPVKNPADLPDFILPFAIDESLRDTPLARLLPIPNLSHLIIKPTMTGGYFRCLPLTQLGKKLVLSPSFESGIGIAHIAQLAQRLGLGNSMIGLDTYRYLEADLLQQPLQFKQGKLWINSNSLLANI